LQKTLEYYNIQTPEYQKYCTYRIFKANLAWLCHYYNIDLNHHDALSDALACAQLFLIHLAAHQIDSGAQRISAKNTT
jgi:DNA polymerase-3 subunit epsilon